MAFLVKLATKKMLAGELEKYKSKDVGGKFDPYYMEVPNPKRPGKMKKVKRQIPDYIPTEDAKILAQARKRAYKLDYSLFNFLGLRFGWSSVIALAPAVGDTVDLGIAANHVRKMRKIEGGIPGLVLFKMLLWIFIDFVVGFVPFLGDLLDAAVKCNSRNVRYLEEVLDERYKPKDVEAGGVPANGGEPATVWEDFSDDEEAKGASAGTPGPNVVPQPSQARTRDRPQVAAASIPQRNGHN
ncbi:hypothetical protein M011DRAFT_471286 [Sporormia fimetaria CBS 119925]|uniref:DUF4112 domain-containing protein n=1 Tax=Sporormia fimetaria CBS 119925 TaxID=1340428 RepID=A0A6A6V1B6_9PLEO|nr:hypothetical protein M011DRAFT_471286 [Sporormia fimetaria CBS 119925]